MLPARLTPEKQSIERSAESITGSLKTGGYVNAGFAHDLRGPLTTINLATEILTRIVTNDLQRSYLDMILRATASINLQVTQLVGQHHLDNSGKIIYSIHRLLDDVLLLAQDRLQLKNILVRKVYTKRNHERSIDLAGMKMALTNIIINAIEAMKALGQLKLTTRFISGCYTIIIEDDGCGISATNLPFIFRPYFSSKENGLGIGLAATHDLLKLNSISVSVESTELMGTKFILSFPRNSDGS